MSKTEKIVWSILSEYLVEDGSSAKALDADRATEICQTIDPKLQRTKKSILLPAITKAINRLRIEEKQNTPTADADSDFEGVDVEKLVTVPESESNVMNQATVDLWNVPKAGMEKREAPKASKESKKKKRKIAASAADRRPATQVTLADLGGIDNIIAQILELLAMPLSHPEIYVRLGSEIPRGVLLHGPPGCGKTVLANAIANELGVPFINVSAPSVVSGMSGESEKKLRDIFEEAKELAPCLVFIDEIDAITPKRESVQREMERRIVAQLLTCMDDVALEKTGGRPVMIIGATNRPDAIDPALRRGGRFDHEISMSVPDQESRKRILETIGRKLRLEGNFDFEKIAKMTPGYVGADLNALVAAAGVAAIKRIFGDLGDSMPEAMEVDQTVPEGGQPDQSEQPAPPAPPANPRPQPIRSQSLISKFLQRHPDPLTAEELEPLAITYEDFLVAIPTIQPSSKREGFATVPDVSWEDVGAMGPIREELEYAIVEPIKQPEVYAAAGIAAPSGVLLWGPPGCGKTLLAKAVANESRANFISVRGPELLNKYVGESERAVRQVFTRARASAPCVIFFDELDALVPRRDDTNSESSSRVVNTLLTELDGVGDRNGIYVVAATNRPDMIDAAMLRPGRLDKQLFVELPEPEERYEILKTVSRKAPLDDAVDLKLLAHDEKCRNFSGADLAALVREASVLALKSALKSSSNTAVKVSMEDFNAAFKKVRPSVNDNERQKYYLMQERMAS
ncbi:putative AAA domain-containing protein C16E9.10c [Wickerhamiella sorbophila]|uniref:Peroxisomal ATPase PEX1 n=1 Tax=Wickerhamiella sorbophila TaxID=45607 RepID=A0A2T0FF49_9ASCO|nr:putative AAA domain-containing protein C16E9.10c [Wickerhamiella sorbophila]PRT53587.1 putative AAA domain-containing protein C16E9.10c [Wickerhamiella sorbophila]